MNKKQFIEQMVEHTDSVKSRAPCKRVAAIVPSRYSFFPFWSWLPPLLVGQRVYAKFSP
jgi:hypothetical protein